MESFSFVIVNTILLDICFLVNLIQKLRHFTVCRNPVVTTGLAKSRQPLHKLSSLCEMV